MVLRVNLSKFRKLVSTLSVALLLITIFIGLGIWQLQRAADLQELQKQLVTISTKRDILMEQDEITPRIENKIMEYENMIGLLLEEIKDYK